MFVKKKFVFGDMSKVLRGFEGKWVALSVQDEQMVISGSGESPGEAIQRARERGVDDPILVRVPSEPISYVI
jgi:hypothetical protein